MREREHRSGRDGRREEGGRESLEPKPELNVLGVQTQQGLGVQTQKGFGVQTQKGLGVLTPKQNRF